MGTASVGPAEGESFFVAGPALEEKFVIRVKEEDAECAMRHGVFLSEVSVGMSSPLIDGTKKMIIVGD